MKIKCSFVQSLGGIILLGILLASPGWASRPSIQTALVDPMVIAGDEFHLSVILDLDDAPSSGGYVDLVYDPNVLECVEIQNFDIFGFSGVEIVSCPEGAELRVTSRTISLSDVLTFPSLETYAMVTFRAKQAEVSTAVQFVDTSQIFGVGGGNILTERDDSATRHITIEAEAVLPPDPVDDPFPGDEEPAPDDFTPGDEEPAPDDFTPGDEESVPPPAVPVVVPEPSTWLLLILGLGGILFMRRRKN